MKIKLLYFFFLITSVTCCQQSAQFVDYKNEQIEYMGRMTFTDTSGAEMYWSGSSIKLNFTGTMVKALLKDEKGDNYFNIIIDNGTPVVIRPGTTRSFYTLATDLENKAHTVQIYKRTEWDRGTSWFYGFELDNGATLLPRSAHKERRIEFYGNSITAGYAVEDTTGHDSPDSIYTNSYLSYATLTARHFDADYNLIVKSGIGITISWFPFIMPDIYDLTNPSNPDSKWDFSKFKPELVIINLFQNDSWLVNLPDREEFKATFGTQKPGKEFLINAYINFVKSLRDKYPEAKIICMLGNMDITREGSPWPDYVRQAVAHLNDPDIFTFFEPFKNTPGHPDIAEQKVLANGLIQFIEKTMGW
jgi:Carbohydrate esterase 2 N-terminal/GDSL-like Lipase/Acylhydrolase family